MYILKTNTYKTSIIGKDNGISKKTIVIFDIRNDFTIIKLIRHARIKQPESPKKILFGLILKYENPTINPIMIIP